MAHQCLKCGHAYPDGSPQILKGCESCKGTRFFYTDKPLDDDARAAVAERTEVDLERLALGKSDPAPAPRRIPTKDELPLGTGKDWVELGPNYLRNVVEDVVRRAGERKPVFRVGATPESKPTLAEWVREHGGPDAAQLDDAGLDDAALDPAEPDRPTNVPERAGPEGAPASADELLDDLVRPDREEAWRRASRPTPEPPGPATAAAPEHDDEDAAASADEVVYKRAPRRVPKPVSLAGVPVDASEDEALREKARLARERLEREAEAERAAAAAAEVSEVAEEGSLYPEGQRPETVGVPAPGVYELDVKRLMERSPIVVHKDGTYSLHLPSLMDSVNRDKRRR